MARSYGDPIAVRTHVDGGLDVPTQFIWRAALWRVIRVQRHWVEASPWWDRALLERAGNEAAQASERHVWRVEAAPGSHQRVNIYDLASSADQWWLQGMWD